MPSTRLIMGLFAMSAMTAGCTGPANAVDVTIHITNNLDHDVTFYIKGEMNGTNDDGLSYPCNNWVTVPANEQVTERCGHPQMLEGTHRTIEYGVPGLDPYTDAYYGFYIQMNNNGDCPECHTATWAADGEHVVELQLLVYDFATYVEFQVILQENGEYYAELVTPAN